MDYEPVLHSTFALERFFSKPSERVFGVLADPGRKRRWFAEGDSHDVEEFAMDFRVGGTERLRYRLKPGTPLPGVVIVDEGVFQDIVPNRRVVVASAMTLGGRRISASLVTFELWPERGGTKLVCTFQGAFFEGSGGPQLRQSGWGKLLDRLAEALSQEDD